MNKEELAQLIHNSVEEVISNYKNTTEETAAERAIMNFRIQQEEDARTFIKVSAELKGVMDGINKLMIEKFDQNNTQHLEIKDLHKVISKKVSWHDRILWSAGGILLLISFLGFNNIKDMIINSLKIDSERVSIPVTLAKEIL